MTLSYSERLSLMYALCLNETRPPAAAPDTRLQDYDPLEAAEYLACYLTFQAIRETGRSPADERLEQFDMLSVYHAYAMLLHAFLTLPLGAQEMAPQLEKTAVVVAKTLFAGLTEEEWAEIMEAGARKFQLIAEAEQTHWAEYRQNLDKATVAFVIAGTDDDAPVTREEVIPVLGTLLSMLCEAFAET